MTNPDMHSQASANLEGYDHGNLLTPTELTSLQDLVLTKVDDNYPKLQLYVSAVIFSAIAIGISLLITLVSPLELFSKMLALSIIIALVIGLSRLTYLKALTVCYGVFKDEFIMRQGLFWISTTALPYTRLQHVNLSQGPLERKYQLITLKCFSAGSGEAEINLPGYLLI
ncbi:PH domain-containing protein [Shewanella sp. OMA3-2]|uniref:PH domain-containing protein n=1 Tax=Shewanella sp. OMA3-2 TaxID=2908650 RepID=UPI001F345CF4|nr:PH domain-containing protein [Shewanella sp. OMA3-2]UJF23009.1 PH domain-containing protein [Shewanella sp. OMA3-2]